MVIKLKDMQKRYMAYVDEELDKRQHEDKILFLQEYITEKSEIYKIFYDDLINKTENIDKLKAYMRQLASSLYWLFNQRDKNLEEDI